MNPLSVPKTPLDVSSVPELFERRLNDDGEGDYVSAYVDKNGNEYEPYSMGWRYLGMYLDCEVGEYNNDDVDYIDDEGVQRRRNLNSGSGSGDGECSRKLLWAAYVDPRYQGGSIGEYQYYDPYSNTWDDTSCQTRRCAKMDCHDPHTHFRLVGVFKETDGLYDWGEQLFKHHGYCQWDEDTYETMQELLEDWPQDGCKKLDYSDSNGNTLYAATKPLPEGNLTVALYYNEQCTQDSGMLWSDYIVIYYENYYYYYYYTSQGPTKAKKWLAKMDLWNEAMAVYKICQPCRAYNLNQEGSGSGSGSGDRRQLDNNEDGGGDAEQWGYDCDDDAGYTNCNQCYKFQTQTSMEPAVKSDLQLASSQGTLIGIRVNRTWYGEGGYRSPSLYPSQYVQLFGGILAMSALALLCIWKCFQLLERRTSRSLEEKLHDALDYTTNCALAGIECDVTVRAQKPTASDPLAVDFVRFPRVRNNNINAPSSPETSDDEITVDERTVESKDGDETNEPSYVSMDDDKNDESNDKDRGTSNASDSKSLSLIRFLGFRSHNASSNTEKSEEPKEATDELEGMGIEQSYVPMDELEDMSIEQSNNPTNENDTEEASEACPPAS